MSIIAQTLSSSVADAIQFLEESGNFKGAGATVKFIRIVDRLFDLLNSRNPFAKGFKAPMSVSNRQVWENVIVHSIDY